MNIKQLKEIIKDLPDDMEMLMGSEGQVITLSDKNFYVGERSDASEPIAFWVSDD